jgi:hypothetical protein
LQYHRELFSLIAVSRNPKTQSFFGFSDLEAVNLDTMASVDSKHHASGRALDVALLPFILDPFPSN